jgi:hypothetical protein
MRMFDVATLMQFIKKFITLSYIKRVFNIVLPFFMSRLQRITVKDLALDGQTNSAVNTSLDSSSKLSELGSTTCSS